MSDPTLTRTPGRGARRKTRRGTSDHHRRPRRRTGPTATTGDRHPPSPNEPDANQFWQVNAGREYGISGTALDRELDWTAPWEHLVEESRTWSLLDASEAPVGEDIFVAPSWIDRSDLHPKR